MIDDMEATDPSILMAGGRNGTWWAGGDPASPSATIYPNGEASATLIPGGGRCGSLHAMRVSGQGFTQWAEVTASMRYGVQDGGTSGLLPYDASFRTGITFWARIGDTSANYVRFAVSDQYSRPEGGHCDATSSTGATACYDEFGVDLSTLGTTWTQYRIPFAGLGQRNFGLQRPALDTTAIYSIDFNFNVGEIFDFWIRRYFLLLEVRSRAVPTLQWIASGATGGELLSSNRLAPIVGARCLPLRPWWSSSWPLRLRRPVRSPVLPRSARFGSRSAARSRSCPRTRASRATISLLFNRARSSSGSTRSRIENAWDELCRELTLLPDDELELFEDEIRKPAHARHLAAARRCCAGSKLTGGTPSAAWRPRTRCRAARSRCPASPSWSTPLAPRPSPTGICRRARSR